MITGSYAFFHVHNLNDNPLAIISLGKAQVQKGYVRIIYPIDFAEIEQTLANIDEIDVKQEFYKPFYNLIEARKQKLNDSFLKLRPLISRRSKRWDLIGTTWKLIGGNPDAEDLRIIEKSLNQLTVENNKQIVVNEAIEERLNNITTVINSMIRLEKEQIYNHTLLINLLIVFFNIESLQEQINIIEESISTAKHGIPNSKLFTTRDFQYMMDFLNSRNMQISSIDQPHK